MQNSQDTSSGNMNPKLPENEVQAAKKIIESLLLAMKMSSLYPKGHTIYDKAIVQVHNNLGTFFQIQERLRLDVEKDRLFFDEEVVLAGSAEEGNLAFTLFRDGIQWLEFQEGIDLSEIKQFLGMLNPQPQTSFGKIICKSIPCSQRERVLVNSNPFWERNRQLLGEQ